MPGLWIWAVAHATPDETAIVIRDPRVPSLYGAVIGVGWRSRQLGFRVRRTDEADTHLRPGFDIRLASTQPLGARPRFAVRPDFDRMDSTTVLVGAFVDVRLKNRFYLSFGANLDFLKPVRAFAAIDGENTGGDILEAILSLPLGTGLLLFGSEQRFTAGVEFVEGVTLDVGLWPISSAWGPLIFTPKEADPDLDWVRALQPGVSVAVLL